MVSDPGDRMKIVIGYALWATVCAAVAGAALSLVHTWFFSYHAGRPGFWSTLIEDFATTLGIAAGQGAVALVGGGIPARVGGALPATGLLGPLVGAFGFVIKFLPMAVPPTQPRWGPPLVLLAAGPTGKDTAVI